MLTLLIASALAAPPGFTASKSTSMCELYVGAPLPNGVVPLAAECVWPDVDFDTLDGLLSKWSNHDAYFSTVAVSEEVKVVGGKAWVRQVHQSKGISDRECMLVMEKTQVGDAVRYAWKMDNAGFEPGDGRVSVAWDEGYWQIEKAPEGGVKVDYRLAYDPGGSVPGFLVRWFQTSGLTAIVTEMHDYAAK